MQKYLIQKGYIVHCTDAFFKYFSPLHIKGGSRAKEGYGIYFSDMPYKPIEYGDIFKVVKKSDFNFINSQDPITKYSYIFNNDILTDIYRLERRLDTIRNVREYDELNAEISRLRNEYKKIGEYKVKEVYNDNGKKIQELLTDIFKSYCKEKMEKEVFG